MFSLALQIVCCFVTRVVGVKNAAARPGRTMGELRAVSVSMCSDVSLYVQDPQAFWPSQGVVSPVRFGNAVRQLSCVFCFQGVLITKAMCMLHLFIFFLLIFISCCCCAASIPAFAICLHVVLVQLPR